VFVVVLHGFGRWLFRRFGVWVGWSIGLGLDDHLTGHPESRVGDANVFVSSRHGESVPVRAPGRDLARIERGGASRQYNLLALRGAPGVGSYGVRHARRILPFNSVAGVDDNPSRVKRQVVCHPNDNLPGRVIAMGTAVAGPKERKHKRATRNKEASAPEKFPLAGHELLSPASAVHFC
jgi:hypothetical protein